MLSWIWNILIGNFCNHKWVQISKDEVFTAGERLPINIDYILQCEKCGNIKRVRT